MKQLIAKDEMSRQQYDAAVAATDVARASRDAAQAALAEAEKGVAAAEARLSQSRAGIAEALAAVETARSGPSQVSITRSNVSAADARVLQARAALARAELDLEYTGVRAPVAGILSMKKVVIGQVIQRDQPLMAIVPLDEVWVTANFKEDQLNDIRVGHRATISVDAYGGRTYLGHVESIAAATGARFSLLPPENASGNYVKVVQRIPVKIVLEEGQNPEHLLRPGMSVVPTVFTK
jgi:membrane fusion protein (multidrug efflux system)